MGDPNNLFRMLREDWQSKQRPVRMVAPPQQQASAYKLQTSSGYPGIPASSFYPQQPIHWVPAPPKGAISNPMLNYSASESFYVQQQAQQSQQHPLRSPPGIGTQYPHHPSTMPLIVQSSPRRYQTATGAAVMQEAEQHLLDPLPTVPTPQDLYNQVARSNSSAPFGETYVLQSPNHKNQFVLASPTHHYPSGLTHAENIVINEVLSGPELLDTFPGVDEQDVVVASHQLTLPVSLSESSQNFQQSVSIETQGQEAVISKTGPTRLMPPNAPEPRDKRREQTKAAGKTHVIPESSIEKKRFEGGAKKSSQDAKNRLTTPEGWEQLNQWLKKAEKKSDWKQILGAQSSMLCFDILLTLFIK